MSVIFSAGGVLAIIIVVACHGELIARSRDACQAGCVAHEIGHSLGMDHEAGTTCPNNLKKFTEDGLDYAGQGAW